MSDLSSLIADQWRPIAEADKDIAYIHDMGDLRRARALLGGENAE